MLPRAITVQLIPREDGGLRVSSVDVPGLILSGPDPARVMAQILPAARAILTLKGPCPHPDVKGMTMGECFAAHRCGCEAGVRLGYKPVPMPTDNL
jgi:hypothetical protein